MLTIFDLDQPSSSSSSSSSGDGCFPTVAKVKIENGDTVVMSQLEIGDQVQIGIKRFS